MSWSPSNIPYGNVGDFTFTANWKKSEFRITFDYNDGSGIKKVVSREYMSRIGEIPVPSEYDDRDFIGWFTDNLHGRQISGDEMVEGNITYYAHWSEDDVLIEIRNGVDRSAISTVDSNNTIKILRG